MQVSKRFYIGAPIALLVAMFALLLTSPSYDVDEAGPRLAIPLLVHIVIQLRLVYIAWASIQDGATRLSPRLAAGLLLVPVFNLFWVFPAVWGFSKNYNSYIRRRRLAVQPLVPWIYLLFCIMFCFLVTVNLLGFHPPGFVTLSSLLMYFGIVAWTCDAINALEKATVLPESHAGDFVPPGMVPVSATERRLHLSNALIGLGELAVMFIGGAGGIILLAAVFVARSLGGSVLGGTLLAIAIPAWVALRRRKESIKRQLADVEREVIRTG